MLYLKELLVKVKERVEVKVRIFKYKIRCWWWNFRIPKDLNLYLKRWQAIDRRRDKSISSEDFRFWFYLRKLEEK